LESVWGRGIGRRDRECGLARGDFRSACGDCCTRGLASHRRAAVRSEARPWYVTDARATSRSRKTAIPGGNRGHSANTFASGRYCLLGWPQSGCRFPGRLHRARSISGGCPRRGASRGRQVAFQRKGTLMNEIGGGVVGAGFIAIAILVFLVLLGYLVPLRLWIAAWSSGAYVGLVTLIGMRLRR